MGALAALLDIDMAVIEELIKETFGDKEKLIAGNLKAIELGYNYAKEHFSCPLPLKLEPMDRPPRATSWWMATPWRAWAASTPAPL